MTARHRQPRADTARVYEYLRNCEEAAARYPDRRLPRSSVRGVYKGSPQRLAAVRGGEPWVGPWFGLPRWARAEDARPEHWPRRARVYPDGTVEVFDDVKAWLRENGLGPEDTTGIPPEVYAATPPAQAYSGCTFDRAARRYRRHGKLVPISGDPGFQPETGR